MGRIRYSFSSRRTGNIKNIRKQKKKFSELTKEILDSSDVILEVLDARFIQETRNKDLENEILRQKKKLIYVINKSDLVELTPKILEVNSLKIAPYIFVSSKNRTGIAKLKERIKIEVKKIDKEDLVDMRAQIGVLGFPNTGKSSLINVLSGRASAKISNQAGFTKGMQKIRLTAGIVLLDTPGVIPESEYSHTREDAIKKHAKLGARTLNTIKDPEMVVFGLMKEYSKDIEKFYKIDAQGDTEMLIENLGRKKGFLRKGGMVDEDRTSKMIIRDWQEGRIKITEVY